MPMPKRFSKPWVEIDPSLAHGGIDGELNQFVAPDLGDNTETKNADMLKIFAAVRDFTQSVSMNPEANKQGQPGRRIVEETLKGINHVFETIVDVTHTDATRFFQWCHAIPPYQDFALSPVRYPLRQEFAQEVVHYGIGTMVEIAEANRNANHSGIDPQTADVLIAPLYYLKAKIMKHYFDLEVAGEISSSELKAMFDGRYRPGPTVSHPDESAERPDAADVDKALTGVDVMQWYPSMGDWATFGKLNEDRYTPERIYQPEAARPTTEDVSPPNPVNPTTGQSVMSQP